MTVLSYLVAVFVGYTFGRWVKAADLVRAHFEDRNEIERLRAQVVELEEEVRQQEVDERTVTWQ